MSQKVSLLFFASLVFVQGCFTSSDSEEDIAPAVSEEDKDICTQQTIGEVTQVSCWEDDGSGQQQFFKEGKLHRDGDLPAKIGFWKDGTVRFEEFYKEGFQHRDGDLPAEVWYYSDGKVWYELFYKEGLQHRDGGLPAKIYYYSDGTVASESFYENWVLLRSIEYYADGTVKYKDFYKEGKLHRDAGLPAKIFYEKDGTVLKEEFYNKGIRCHVLYDASGRQVPEIFYWKFSGTAMEEDWLFEEEGRVAGLHDEVVIIDGFQYKFAYSENVKNIAPYDGWRTTVGGIQYKLVHVE